MDIISYIGQQIKWSRATFGEGRRTKGIIEHIKLELVEIEAEPDHLMEWVDVIILALDGAWRSGHTPYEIVDALLKKAQINHTRTYPKPESEDVPVLHVPED